MHMSHAELQKIKTELLLHRTAVQTCSLSMHTLFIQFKIELGCHSLSLCQVTFLALSISTDITPHTPNFVLFLSYSL